LSEPILRAATPADVPALARLARDSFVAAFGQMYSAADLAAFLAAHKSEAATAALVDDPEGLLQVAERDGAMIAYCKIGFHCGWPDHARGSRVMELKQLYAAAEATGGGVGSRLMDWAMAQFAARGADEIQLSVWSGNHRAQRFYARYGFEKVADVTFQVGAQTDAEFLFARML
jgi:ribosomal protein S18 acetylase RimI-like enzyme